MSSDRQIHIKSPGELKIMRQAGRINAEILATMKNLIQPGVSTADLNAAAEEVLKKHGCYSPFKGYSQPPFPASICTSVNEELVHGIPSKKRILREGDIISVDCGTVFEGFPLSQSAWWKSRKARWLRRLTKCASAIAQAIFRRRSRITWKAAACTSRANTPVMVWDGRCMKAPWFPILGRRAPECLFVRE